MRTRRLGYYLLAVFLLHWAITRFLAQNDPIALGTTGHVLTALFGVVTAEMFRIVLYVVTPIWGAVLVVRILLAFGEHWRNRRFRKSS